MLRTVFGRVAVPGEGLRGDPARHHAHLRARRRRAVLALLPHARRDRDARTATATATACCSSTRPTRSATSTARPSSRRCDESGEFAGHRARARRLPGLHARPPPVRRRGLGRLRLALHVQRRRLRAARRPLPPAAAGAPDLPGPELRDLHVRAADARLGSRGGAAALPPLEHPVRGGHVLRRGRLRARARAWRWARITLHPVRPAARAAAGRGREGARREEHGRAGDHVGHLPAAAADARSGATTTSPSTRSRGTPTARRPAYVRGGTALLAGHAGREGRGRPPRTTTTPARTTRSTAPAAARSPRPRCAWSPGEPAPAIDYTEPRAGGVAHRLPRARREARALRVPRATATRPPRSTCRATRSPASTRSAPGSSR